MAKTYIFDNDESDFLNHLLDGRNMLQKKDVVKGIEFAYLLTGEECKPMVKSVQNKIAHLSEEEWEEVRALFPLDVIRGNTEEELEELFIADN